jgi:ABC-2 type transport system permease protein
MDLLYIARGPQAALTYYLADMVIGVAAATATFLLAERFDGIGTWSRPQVLFMLGYALLVRMLISSFFNFNVAHFSRRIGRGQLDHLLIQPQPLWLAVLTEGFAPVSGSGMVLPAAVLLAAAQRELHLELSPGWWGLLVIDLLASTVVVMSFEFIWASVAFWAPRAAEEINSHTWDLLTALTPFPLDGLSAWALGALLTVVPAGLVAWFPSRTLLGIGPPNLTDATGPTLAAVLFAALAVWTFNRGLHQYGRTGSSRYLDYGHRR